MMTPCAEPVAATPAPRLAAHPDPLIIGLVGRAGSGKDTAAARLVEQHHFEPHSFAGPVRDMIDTMLGYAGLNYAYIHERNLKEQPIPGLGVSYRHLAQTLGTEWGRQCIAPDLWVRIAELALGLPEAPVHDRIVMTDVRFANEAAMIRSRRGVLVRIVRDVAPVRGHVSEDELLYIPCQATIHNDGSLASLFDQVDDLMATLAEGGIA